MVKLIGNSLIPLKLAFLGGTRTVCWSRTNLSHPQVLLVSILLDTWCVRGSFHSGCWEHKVFSALGEVWRLSARTFQEVLSLASDTFLTHVCESLPSCRFERNPLQKSSALFSSSLSDPLPCEL